MRLCSLASDIALCACPDGDRRPETIERPREPPSGRLALADLDRLCRAQWQKPECGATPLATPEPRRAMRSRALRLENAISEAFLVGTAFWQLDPALRNRGHRHHQGEKAAEDHCISKIGFVGIK